MFFAEAITPAFEILVTAWVFFFGACVGSFLNVVVYRLPLGKSLVRPGSHCPACGNPIRWWHNLPILGWLILRGRCFDCRVRISPRYPLVELTVGLLFVGLMQVDVPPAAPLGVESWLVLIGHGWLLCTLLAATLIVYDGGRPPVSLWVAMWLVALAVTLTAPEIQARGAWPAIGTWLESHDALSSRSATALANSLVALAIGGALGLAADRLFRTGRAHWLALACVGQLLGPKLVILAGGVVAASSAIAWALGATKKNSAWLPSAALLALAAAWIFSPRFD